MSVTTEPRKTLFDIGDDLAQIQAEIVDAGGELSPELESRLNAVYEALEDKVDRVGYRRRAIQTQASLHAERAAFHLAQKRAYEAMEERLDSYLLAAMQRLGTKKLVGTDFTATIVPSKRVVIERVDLLPEEYWRPPAAPEVNLALVRKQLMDGVEVPGARLEEHDNLRVK